jgi:hypothetical protein
MSKGLCVPFAVPAAAACRLFIGILQDVLPYGTPRADGVTGVDVVVVAAILAATLGTASLCAFLAVKRALGAGRLFAHLSVSRSAASIPRKQRCFAQILAMATIALATVLLIFGGSFTAYYWRCMHTEPGFDPQMTLGPELGLSDGRYDFLSRGLPSGTNWWMGCRDTRAWPSLVSGADSQCEGPGTWRSSRF